jgi:predicted extracellular nuclease/methionine-rich copper-binding protein CopC
MHSKLEKCNKILGVAFLEICAILSADQLGKLYMLSQFNTTAPIGPDIPSQAAPISLAFILAFLSFFLFPHTASAQTAVFFNEIHYDNDGTDTGEAIEIAGPAGTDLTGWSIVLYNGAGGASYDTKSLNGVIPNSGGSGFGVVVVSYPANGIQNGSPDGMALVNGATVVQFLSYEGVFTATNGPAAGLTSIDIGVAEPGTTPVGHALQLSGMGSTYENFTWLSPAANTFGAFNNNQTFSTVDVGPSVSTTAPPNNATNVALNANIAITFSEPVNVAGNWFMISGAASGSHTATVSGGPTTFMLDPDIDFANNENISVTVFAANVTDQDVDDPPDSMTTNFNFSFTTVAGDLAPTVANTSPNNGEAGVDVAANITITFSEPVNVTGNWFNIIGATGGMHTATVSGGPTSFTLDPNLDFVPNETVTVNILAANVTDQDTIDPPDNMAADYTFTFTTPSLIINEILADPNDDANGDGTFNATQDEFIELVNVSGVALDISGWTLSDAVQVRHTFPVGTIISNLCAVVIFGGGTPTGAFGNALVQTAGQLGLNNTSDTVTLKNGATVIATYTYGAEGGNDQSLTRNPDITGAPLLVQHTTATGAAGRLHSPGVKVDGTSFSGCAPLNAVKEIFEIQGAGLASPFVNQIVTTENNVVTVVNTNGFFMQTPAARGDNNAQTSDGIFVFTGAAPTVSVSDLVNVTGNVIEFFNFTEFSNSPIVTVVSSGQPLPPAMQFDALTPSPNQPHSPIEFERFEGMLVQIANGAVAASNQTFSSDRFAEVLAVAGPNRPFREPGIEYPGRAGLPVWDNNPEIFEFDPDHFGQPNMVIPAGSTFSATGILGYEFGDYEFWPTSYSVSAATLPRAVRPRNAGESTIATLNLHLFYDDIDDSGIDEPVRTPQAYADKLNKLSLYIRTLLGAPDILAVQEAEKLQVLVDLANTIKIDDAALIYAPYLLEGNDISGIDIGFLVRREVTVKSVTQLGATEIFSADNSRLHDRPPLLLQAKLQDSSDVAVFAVHLRSLNGIDDSSEGPRVRQKRHEQAVAVANMVQAQQTNHSNIRLAVVGDFNAFQFTDGYVHVLGQIMGIPAPATAALIPGTDLVNPDLINAMLALPENERYSFVFQGTAQALDHILVSQNLQPLVTGIQYARANADAAENFEADATTPLRVSDHDGLVLFVKNSPPTKVASEQLSISNYQLAQNYPNPFAGTVENPSTAISFQLPINSQVKLAIYSVTGQLVSELANDEMAAGRHVLSWDGRDRLGNAVAAGLYLYRLAVTEANGEVVFTQTRRLVVIR